MGKLINSNKDSIRSFRHVAKPTPKMNRGGIAKPAPRSSCCRGNGGRVAPKPAPRPAPRRGGSRGGGLITK
jgi:hypothetical protein